MRLYNPMRIVLLAGAIMTCAATCHPQQKDVLGWEDSRWGMSETRLVNTLGARLTKLPKPQSFLDLHVDHVIALELQGEQFTVFFQMENRTNTLSQVLVRLDEMETRQPREDLFTKLEFWLTKQYGPATSRSNERDSRSAIKSLALNRTWKFLTTTVELAYEWDNQIYASLLTVRYFPTNGAAIDQRRITTRWTGAAGACFASGVTRRRLNEIAPPGQL